MSVVTVNFRSGPGSFTKTPLANLDYTVDWGDWLDGLNDAIVESNWVIPDGILLSAATSDTRTATGWLTGGEVGQDYLIINQITTADGRMTEKSFTVRVRNP
jgi:hypothetical protein